MTTITDDQAAMELIATLIQQSSDDLAHTTNALIQHHKDDSVALANALTRLVDAIDSSPTIDRKVESALTLDSTIVNGLIVANSVLRQEEMS